MGATALALPSTQSFMHPVIMLNGERVLSMEETAARLGISLATLRRRVRRGELLPLDLRGRKVFREADLS